MTKEQLEEIKAASQHSTSGNPSRAIPPPHSLKRSGNGDGPTMPDILMGLAVGEYVEIPRSKEGLVFNAGRTLGMRFVKRRMGAVDTTRVYRLPDPDLSSCQPPSAP